MANPMGGLLRNPAVRAGVVMIVVFGVLGVATGALPVQCLTTGACAPKTADLMPHASLTPTLSATPQTAQIKQVASIPVKTGPSLTNNDVVAGSFAQLKVDTKPPVTTPSVQAPVAIAPPVSSEAAPQVAMAYSDPATPLQSTAAAKAAELTTRIVRTVTINPDGTPVTAKTIADVTPVAPADVAATPSMPAVAPLEPSVSQEPVAVANVEPVPTPVSLPAAAGRTDSAPAAASSKFATITGHGANVRSTPSMAGSRVLFALGPGEKVTVIEKDRHGWMHISDDQGRTGWVYSDFVSRG